MEVHLQGTWTMMKACKNLYRLFQKRNTTSDDYMKEFNTYIKVIELYGKRTRMHPRLVKDKLINMGVQDTDDKTPEANDK